MKLRVHGLTVGSRVNGPGRRNVVHTRGCTLACPGCFNPDSHDPEGGAAWEVEALADHLLGGDPDGISVSGGEPLQQPEALLALLIALRARREGVSILLFSGYTVEEIRDQPLGPAVLAQLDVLVDGRFEVKAMAEGGLRGSANQRIHLLSPRHRPEELADRSTEILIRPDGTLVLSGFPSGKLVGALRRG